MAASFGLPWFEVGVTAVTRPATGGESGVGSGVSRARCAGVPLLRLLLAVSG